MTASLSTALEILVGAFTVAVLLACTVLAVEVAAALLGRRRVEAHPGKRGSVAVLIPAHDESKLIASTIRSIVPQLGADDGLLVVADNCSDDTAEIAAAEGAEVIARTDAVHRGKGYALDAGVRHLASAPPSVVLIVDADCNVSEGTVDRLVRASCATQRPAQALYLMHSPAGAPAPMRIAQFAWLVKNRVRPQGLHVLGLPCQLTGTGMAFPWAVLSRASLATGHLVEDLKLGLELARDGSPPALCPDTLVSSEFPSSPAGVKTQRTRWEHGHLGVIARDAPRLLFDALKARNVALLAMTIDLCVPPTALLVLLAMASLLGGIMLFLLTGSSWVLAAATLAAALIGASVLSSWLVYARGFLPLSDLLRGMSYALRKVPLYMRFLVARQLDWVRSRRD
jgi:cellulose synthase/poly-beta-1,6-N-acetylglucosamine synthase-like glycosyltransferase